MLVLTGLVAVSTPACAQDAAAQVRDAETAVRQKPGDVEALCDLVSAYRRALRLDDALKTAQRAVALDDKSVQAHHQLALTHQARLEFDKAVAQWEKTLALDGAFYKAHYNIGVVHHDWGMRLLGEAETLRTGRRRREAAEKAKEAEPHIKQARASWEASLKINPDHAPSHYNLGVVMHHDEDYDGAIGHYRRAIALDPKHVKAHVNLGLCLARKDQADEAVRLWERAATLEPDLFEPPYNLGVMYAQLGRLNEAVARWEKARDILKPRFDAAEKEKNETLQTSLAPNLANCYYNMGVAFEMQKDYRRAEANLKEAVRVDPNMDEAWQLLRNIQRGER
jgi:tetratricopeptide (TPR) repeat protein